MQTPEAADKTRVSPVYQSYVLAMLTLVYVFNFIDRQLLVILQESIKKELHLSDSQLGWTSGFAFAIFYVILGIPIARIADKGNRRNVITLSLGLWSVMTAVCGSAGNFVQLLSARIGVGVGEAGGSPPAHAMISDYFPPRQRSTALAIYSSGIYLGMLVGFIMGGYLNQHLGWRTAFVIVGIPGAVFSLLFYLSVKEPGRGSTDAVDPGGEPRMEQPSFWKVWTFLFSKRTFAFLAAATSLHVFSIYGLANWSTSFLARLHGMKSADIGVGLGLAYGIGGAIGSFGGGWLTDRFGRLDRRWYMWIPALAVLLSALFEAIVLFSPGIPLTLLGFGCTAAAQAVYLGPAISVAHSLVPASMRALTSAILFLCLNLIGLGLGPWAVGLISDKLAPGLGVQSLRWAMSIVIPVSVGAMALFFATARQLRPPISMPRHRSSDRSR
jgi:predicted MFS family arabinose efflux permease